jgi:hypothetical protein
MVAVHALITPRWYPNDDPFVVVCWRDQARTVSCEHGVSMLARRCERSCPVGT